MNNPTQRQHIAFAVINDLTYDQRMIRICGSLSDYGYEVTLIGRELKESQPIEKEDYNQIRLKCLFNSGPLFYLEYNVRLFFHYLTSSYDVFGAIDLDTSLAVHLAGRIKNRRRILDAHEYFTEVPEVNRRKWVQSVWRKIGRWTVPGFNVRYTVNDVLARELKRVYGVDFGVVMNCPRLAQEPVIDQSIFPNERRPIILYQGAINAGRGIEQAILAMQMIDDAVLWIVGEGDLSGHCRQLVLDHRLQDRVKFLGRKRPEELRTITPRATIGLNLLDGTSLNYYYSLANKFFDYMHAGVPSINMRFPAYEEILARYEVGTCLDQLEPASLAKHINKLLSQPGKLRDMQLVCSIAAENYQWRLEEKNLLNYVQT